MGHFGGSKLSTSEEKKLSLRYSYRSTIIEKRKEKREKRKEKI